MITFVCLLSVKCMIAIALGNQDAQITVARTHCIHTCRQILGDKLPILSRVWSEDGDEGSGGDEPYPFPHSNIRIQREAATATSE